MARPFNQATAEQVIDVAEAVVSLDSADANKIAEFTDLLPATAESALKLATDIGLLTEQNNRFISSSPLTAMLRTPQEAEKIAILRIALQSYLPFQTFMKEHDATQNVTIAARRTKAKLDISSHHEAVKATLLSLATFSGALNTGQGNSYSRDNQNVSRLLQELVDGCREIADATETIRHEIGPDVDLLEPDKVITPLVTGLRHASAGSGREAILQAGIAVENFLNWVAANHVVNITSAYGINAKIQAISQAGHLPKKLENISKYLGHVRNAADHGEDTEIGATWHISNETGRNYIFVAASFLRSVLAGRNSNHVL